MKPTTIEARLDDAISIVVETPAGGYEWTATHDADALEALGRRPVPRGQSREAIGAATGDEFRFRARSVGVTTVRLSLARPWEGRVVDEVEYRVNVAPRSPGATKSAK